MSVDNKDLDHAAQVLDDDHYGLKDVKERILEFLAVRNLTSKGESPVCNRIPGIPDYDLRGHLCGADSVYRIQ